MRLALIVGTSSLRWGGHSVRLNEVTRSNGKRSGVFMPLVFGFSAIAVSMALHCLQGYPMWLRSLPITPAIRFVSRHRGNVPTI